MKNSKNPLSQEIQAYFSHSYRADDRDVNLFFWNLFSENHFFFTVDPKSERLIVPYLERMMRFSDCFIAVVTRRHETIHKIGDRPLRTPQTVWTHSPYIALENYLAELAEKPRLVFVEDGLDANHFGGSEHVHIFERTTLERRQIAQFRSIVRDFAKDVRSYMDYKGKILKSTGRAAIVIDTSTGEKGYTAQTISNIQDALNKGGYSVELISPRMDTQELMRRLSNLELVLIDVRSPYISPETLAFIHAKAIPCIRIAKLNTRESKPKLTLPRILSGYRVGDIDPVIAWKDEDQLLFEILTSLAKFQQTRTLLATFEQGKSYFMSAGRKPARIFVSNSHSLNTLALGLVHGFQAVNIQYFQYQDSMAIGTAWKDELNRKLQEFDIFVALINDDYHSSEWCQLELRTAFERWQRQEVEILPYIIEQTRLPELIKEHIQCAFVHSLSQDQVISQIVKTIDEYLIAKEKSPKGAMDTTLGKELYGAGNKWAVIVGSNYYEDAANYPLLQVCVKDSLALRKQLLDCGYSEKRVRFLTDESDELPNRRNILAALKSCANATEPNDLLLFYYSGHGVEKDGESYLVGRDGRHLVIEETAVSVSKIKEIMRSANAKAKVIIIDACHSGADFGGKGTPKMSAQFIQRVFEEAKGLAILASCEQGQRSYEWRNNQRSAFTYYLLEALDGKADLDDKGFVTVQDVSRYVSNEVKLWASQRNLSQTPTFEAQVAGDIILVRVG